MKNNSRSGAVQYDEVIDFDQIRKERREKRKEKLESFVINSGALRNSMNGEGRLTSFMDLTRYL